MILCIKPEPLPIRTHLAWHLVFDVIGTLPEEITTPWTLNQACEVAKITGWSIDTLRPFWYWVFRIGKVTINKLRVVAFLKHN